MPKMVCVNCQTELQIVKTGAYLIEMFQDPPQPYKIWSTDVWECLGCRQQIVSGFANYPLVEHFEEDFPKILEAVLAQKEWVLFSYEKPFRVEPEAVKRILLKGGDC